MRFKIQNKNLIEEESKFTLDDEGVVLFKDIIYIPNFANLKNLILNEVHKRLYFGHPSYQKTITTLNKEYYLFGMNIVVVEYLVRCLKCHQVEARHHQWARLLHPITIIEWKWEVINNGFYYSITRK